MRRVIYAIIMMCGCIALHAQQPLSKQDGLMQLAEIYSGYRDWQSVELSGKMSLRGLPLRPNVKIYMLRNSRILVSVSAPFVGEVGRVDITKDSVIMINKAKKEYCAEKFTDFKAYVPTALEGLQDVFLGRVFDAGSGTLSQSTAESFAVYDAGDDHLLLVGGDIDPTLGVAYGFSMAPDRALETLLASFPGDGQVQVDYSGKASGGSDVYISLVSDKLNFRVELSLGQPKWEAVPFSTTVINPRFNRVGIKEFLKSF